MPPQDEPLRLRIDLTSEQAYEFMRRLAEDDDFRGMLAADPVGTLAEYGVEMSPARLPEEIELPSKEEVQSMLRDLEEGGELRFPWRPNIFFPIFLFWFVPPFAGRRED